MSECRVVVWCGSEDLPVGGVLACGPGAEAAERAGAALLPVEDFIKPRGTLRLTHYPTPGGILGGLAATASPFDLGTLQEPDEWGGWTIRGEVPFTTINDGFMAVALPGACDAVRVMMSAVGCTLAPRMRA